MKGEQETNEDVMAQVLNELKEEGVYFDSEVQPDSKQKKKKNKKGKRKQTEDSEPPKLQEVNFILLFILEENQKEQKTIRRT